MIPPYLLCDICGEKMEKGTSLCVETSSYLDSDGDLKSSKQFMDLCPNHLKELITMVMRDRDDKSRHELGREIFNTYNEMRKDI